MFQSALEEAIGGLERENGEQGWWIPLFHGLESRGSLPEFGCKRKVHLLPCSERYPDRFQSGNNRSCFYQAGSWKDGPGIV